MKSFNNKRDAELLARKTTWQRYCLPDRQALVRVFAERLAAHEYTSPHELRVGPYNLFSAKNYWHKEGIGIVQGTQFISEVLCQEAGNPMFCLSKKAAWALANTDPPLVSITEELMWTHLRLPFDGLYLKVPEGFTIFNDETGYHKLEGLFIGALWDLMPAGRPIGAKDETKLTTEEIQQKVNSGEWEWGRVITVAGMGKARGAWKIGHSWIPNNAIVTFWVTRRQDLTYYYQALPTEPTALSSSSGLCFRFVVNFLLALNSGYLVLTPTCIPAPKKKKKREREERAGRVFGQYTQVSLRKRSRAPRSNKPTGKTVTSHLVRGHWHGYWVLDPKGNAVAGTKEREDGKTLYFIFYWIMPYYTGDEGLESPPVYTVSP